MKFTTELIPFDPTIPVLQKPGEAFKNLVGHYYLQRAHDVLHVYDKVINSLFVNHLTDCEGLIPISEADFECEIRRAIYELEIDGYWVTLSTENK